MQNSEPDKIVGEDQDQNEIIRCFVPELLIDYLTHVGIQGLKPSSFCVKGVCLLVDISGFRKLSGEFCSRGKNGIDGLQLATNGYMGLLVETIYAYGGDIIKFAGDAIVCIFPATLTTALVLTSYGKILRRSLASVSHCEAEMIAKRTVDYFSTLTPDSFASSICFGDEDEVSCKVNEDTEVCPELVLRAMECADHLRRIETNQLTVHVAVSCGEMCFGILGGYEDRWECLISGPCLQELSSCLDDAPSKSAVISAGCFEVLSALGQVLAQTERPTPDSIEKEEKEGMEEMEKTQLHLCQHSSPPKQASCRLADYVFSVARLPSGNHTILNVSLDNGPADSVARKQGLRRVSPLPNEVRSWKDDSKAMELVLKFVPLNIAESLCSRERLNSISEIREVTTMFMKWDSYDPTALHKDLVALQPCFYQAQKLLHSTGAYLRQFLVDDKGCVLIACWGVPFHSYPDNAHRALTSAVSIHNILPSHDMKCSFGITTGDVYCGTVGSVLRMEYAAIGSVVNLSARLMGKAHGSILLDEPTFTRLPYVSQSRLVKCTPIYVKGHSELVQVYEHVAPEHTCRVGLEGGVQEGLTVHPACLTPFNALLCKLHASVGMIEGPPEVLQVLLVEGPSNAGRKASMCWLVKRAMVSQTATVHVQLTDKSTLSSYCLLYGIFCQCAPKDLYSCAITQRHYVNALLRGMYPNDAETAQNIALPTLANVFALTFGTQRDGSNANVSFLSTTSSSARRVRSNQRVTAAMAHEVLCKLMRHLLCERTLLVIIDDIQLADDKSLRVLADVLNSPCQSIVVLSSFVSAHIGNYTTRGSARSNNQDFARAQYESNEWQTTTRNAVVAYIVSVRSRCSAPSQCYKTADVIQLDLLTELEVTQLLSATLNTRTLPPQLVHAVMTLSGGGFNLVKECLHCIRERGAESFLDTIVLSADSAYQRLPGGAQEQRNGSCHDAQFRLLHTAHSQSGSVNSQRNSPRGRVEFDAFARANSTFNTNKLDHLVVCRYEQLNQTTRQILRTASILGPSFSRQVLYGVVPRALKPEISDCLTALIQQQWLYPMPHQPDCYTFQSNYTHRILYEITPASERRHIHLTIATYLEELAAGELAGAAQLAYHYGKCDTDKALYYTYQAAVRILLQQRASFELCDCLDMLFAAVEFCTTVYDVETLLRVGSDVTTKTLNYQRDDVEKKKEAVRKITWFWRMLSFCVPHGESTRLRQLREISPLQSQQDIFDYVDELPEGRNSAKTKERSVTIRTTRTPRHGRILQGGAPETSYDISDDFNDVNDINHLNGNEDRDVDNAPLSPAPHRHHSHSHGITTNNGPGPDYSTGNPVTEEDEDDHTAASFNTVARCYFAEKFQELRALLLQRKQAILQQDGYSGKIKYWQTGILGYDTKTK